MKWTSPTDANKLAVKMALRQTFDVRRETIQKREIPVVMEEYPRLMDFEGEMVCYYNFFK
jgi:hypothetical protein